MIIGKVHSITMVEHISDELDLCKIEIDFDSLHIFGVYSDLAKYLDKTVQYTIRKDMYNGQQITVVANLVDNYTVQTVDKVEGIRLIPEDCENRVVSNFCINDLKFGDSDRGCIGFVADAKDGSSQYTKWVDLTMIDSKAKQFILRVFTKRVEGNIDAREAAFALIGHYAKFDITHTKFGYQTDDIQLYSADVVPPPEVDTAIAIIQAAAKDDEELLDYMDKYEYIDTLKRIIDGELGYHLVRVASEIQMIETLGNITNLYDKQLMVRAAITSRGYLLPAKTKFSRPVLNVNKVIKTKLVNCKELILIMDPCSEEELGSGTKRMYIEISKFVSKVIDERRGVDEKDSNDVNLSQLRSMYGGLL